MIFDLRIKHLKITTTASDQHLLQEFEKKNSKTYSNASMQLLVGKKKKGLFSLLISPAVEDSSIPRNSQERVIHNRSNVTSSRNAEGGTPSTPLGKLEMWLSKPLCMGMNRLNGTILFCFMIFLGLGSFSGLIASLVLYLQGKSYNAQNTIIFHKPGKQTFNFSLVQDRVTDAQWKILGIVVCALMLTTVALAFLTHIYCYKNGYMLSEGDSFYSDDDDSKYESKSSTQGSRYKYKSPADLAPTQLTPGSLSIGITDKQTNTVRALIAHPLEQEIVEDIDTPCLPIHVIQKPEDITHTELRGTRSCQSVSEYLPESLENSILRSTTVIHVPKSSSKQNALVTPLSRSSSKPQVKRVVRVRLEAQKQQFLDEIKLSKHRQQVETIELAQRDKSTTYSKYCEDI
ncbi:unnamed protein product [Didymodactylos carnosus]|uniref:Uncharacterized protein n=1 Tax=Didymodactylos carnosus TaxID=1234261 RepID=A0A8S2P0U0_9BILA|nr:unnamed protein product [Didymodactylos carnosus]CAF4029185.1 unnamed protein product [Didymodactylos carnosus]